MVFRTPIYRVTSMHVYDATCIKNRSKDEGYAHACEVISEKSMKALPLLLLCRTCMLIFCKLSLPMKRCTFARLDSGGKCPFVLQQGAEQPQHALQVCEFLG